MVSCYTHKRPKNSTTPQKRSTRKDRLHGDWAQLFRTRPVRHTGLREKQQKLAVVKINSVVSALLLKQLISNSRYNFALKVI